MTSLLTQTTYNYADRNDRSIAKINLCIARSEMLITSLEGMVTYIGIL